MIYSPSVNAFFAPEYRSEYEASGTWPTDGIAISEGDFKKFSGAAPEGKRRIAGPDGRPSWGPLPAPSLEQIEAHKVAIVQSHMDAAAQALRYDSIANAVTYAEEPAVPKFQAEGQALRAWRSLVWSTCYAILDDVNAGRRDIPTDAELIEALPPLELPE